jgi:hypothetical protein
MMLWGHADITRLMRMMRQGLSLQEIAQRIGAPVREIDLVLYAKLGRSVPEACDIINGRFG